MQGVGLDRPTQVFHCGGVFTYQLLCGREIAKQDARALGSANYCYLIVNTHDKTAVAVDAAWDIDGLYAFADQLGVKVRGCIYTHFHVDHCGGDTGPVVAMIGRKYLPGAKEIEQRGGKIWAGAADVDKIRKQCSLDSITALDDGDMVDAGDLVLHAVHTPGHSPGSICIYAAPRCLTPRGTKPESKLREELVKADGGLLLTGDTLFVGSCGRTDMKDAGMNPAHMMDSLSRLSKLDPSVLVLPGHNYAPLPFTSIGDERAQNESVQYGMMRTPNPTPLPPCLVCDVGNACGPKDLKIGRKLLISGLQSEAGKALNGQAGVLLGFNSEKGRYSVRLFSANETKVLKPENLEYLVCPPCDTGSDDAKTSPENKGDASAPESPKHEEDRAQAAVQKTKAAEEKTEKSDRQLSQAAVQKTEEVAAEPKMSSNAVTGDGVSAFFDGAVSVECGDGWARPWRICHERLPLYHEKLRSMGACAAVRMILHTSGCSLHLFASADKPELVDQETLGNIDRYPLEYELYVDGSFFARQLIETTNGLKHTVVFDGLPGGAKELELWLPMNAAIAVHAVDAGEIIERRLEADTRPLWVCYGSSITHGGMPSATPSGSWAATCSRLANVRLMNLGYGAECHLDPSVARIIRDTKCSCITLKIGINIHHALGLTARTFPAAVIGFIETIRDGHPDTPLVIVSPIFCGMGEDKAPISASQFLSLKQMRSSLEATVKILQAAGDKCLFYRDGLELLGASDQQLLWDGVHPNAEGNLLMGRRFAALEFGTNGRLLPGRVPNPEMLLKRPDASSELPAGLAPSDLVGAYSVQTPDGGRSRMMVKLEARGLVAMSDRPDWPPAVLDVREDIVFMRNVFGLYARVTDSNIKFNNGIVWIPPKGPAFRAKAFGKPT